MEIARLVIGAILMIASGVVATRLWSEKWLFLVAKPQPKKKKRDPDFSPAAHKAGQRAAWVMVACFAVIATLLAFGMGQMTGVPVFIQTATILNNVALVAFCILVVWTLFASYKDQGGKGRFLDSMGRLAGLMLACCAILTVLSLLFS